MATHPAGRIGLIDRPAGFSASTAPGIGVGALMIFALRLLGGVAGVRPNGRSEATVWYSFNEAWQAAQPDSKWASMACRSERSSAPIA